MATTLVLDEVTARQVTEDTVTAAQMIGATADGYLKAVISKVCTAFGPQGNPEDITWPSLVANASRKLTPKGVAYLMNRGPAVVQRVIDHRETLIY